MNTDYQQKQKDVYTPIIAAFVDGLRCEEFDSTGIVAPHIPACGPAYGKGLPKVAVIGEETRGWHPLSDFIDNPINAINQANSIFDDYVFTTWTNNFGKTFWDTAFKILANVNGEDNWKAVKNRQRKDILNSVLWCNCNSIEGYHITSEHNESIPESWTISKEMSKKHFDKFELIESTFEPDITIIMNWDVNAYYLDIKWDFLDEHLAIGYTDKGSLVYRMAHPSWLNKNRKYDEVLELLFESINKKSY